MNPGSLGRYAGALSLVTLVAFLGIGQGQTTKLGDPAVVNFVNKTGSEVDIFRMDKGKPLSFGKLKSGDSKRINTVIGQAWRVTYPEGVSARTVRSANEEFVIGGTVGTGKLADPTPGGVAIQATGSALTPQEAQALIDFHNKVRKEVGVGPVTWSPTIAKVAQAWADEQARTVKFSHRPNNKFGENLAGFGAGGVLEGANLWYAEKASYTPGTPIPADFNNFKAGHYSQMVWRNSTEFGAGKALYQTTSPSGWPRKGSWVLVGNYNPPGNYSGQKPY